MPANVATSASGAACGLVPLSLSALPLGSSGGRGGSPIKRRSSPDATPRFRLATAAHACRDGAHHSTRTLAGAAAPSASAGATASSVTLTRQRSRVRWARLSRPRTPVASRCACCPPTRTHAPQSAKCASVCSPLLMRCGSPRVASDSCASWASSSLMGADVARTSQEVAGSVGCAPPAASSSAASALSKPPSKSMAALKHPSGRAERLRCRRGRCPAM
eukprot:scaffold6678_cov336-Prasinococcus_capsulatus_cf.AAC.4